jgi:hypothetical protein
MNRISVLALTALVAACSGYSVPPQATPSPIGSDRPTTAPTTAPGATPAPGASGAQAEIEIDITDGPHDGSYRAVASDACKYMRAQNKFTVNYADNAAVDGFVALDLVLNDAALAISDESNDFTAQISVGGANGGVSYSLDPKNGEGDGSVFLDASTSSATLDLEVDARDGAVIELTVICDLS